jgi:cation:H+ antiporter
VLGNSVSLGLGVVFAAVGGELFVRGLVGLASWMRIPAGVIGATVAAFATSSPELTVAVNAGLDGRSEIALGDALGSNMVNIGVVVGLLLLAGSTRASDLSRRDALTGLGLVGLVAVLIVDGELARKDGLVMIVCFSAWFSVVVRGALEARHDHVEVIDDTVVETLGERVHARSIVEATLGLIALVVAGRLLVVGAKGIGEELGLSTFVVGVVLVSFGTSLPELATAIVSKFRGHAELGLGTALGSNIFNIGFIVGVAAILSPVDVDRRDVWISLVLGGAMIPVLLVHTGEVLSRWRGAALIAIYVVAITVLVGLQQ